MLRFTCPPLVGDACELFVSQAAFYSFFMSIQPFPNNFDSFSDDSALRCPFYFRTIFKFLCG